MIAGSRSIKYNLQKLHWHQYPPSLTV